MVGIEKKQWLEYYLPRAEAGDSLAQIELGWAHVRGDLVVRDLDTAEMWFRRAYASGGDEFAAFQLFRMLRMESSPRIVDVYAENDWKLGAIHFIYAGYLMEKDGDLGEANKALLKAIKTGHIPSSIKYYQNINSALSRIITIPNQIYLAIKLVAIRTRDKHDYRTLV